MSVVHFLQAWFLAWKKKVRRTRWRLRIWRIKLHYTSMPYSTAMTWVEENEVWLLASTVSMETVNTRTVLCLHFVSQNANRDWPSPPRSPQQNVLMWHWLAMQLIYLFLNTHIYVFRFVSFTWCVYNISQLPHNDYCENVWLAHWALGKSFMKLGI